jgi:hypothetical protein
MQQVFFIKIRVPRFHLAMAILKREIKKGFCRNAEFTEVKR